VKAPATSDQGRKVPNTIGASSLSIRPSNFEHP
jgi:hypothetical protein